MEKCAMLNEVVESYEGTCEKMDGERGSVNMVMERVLNSIHACFNSFINFFSGKNDGCALPHRRADGGPPAKRGEGPRLRPP